MTMLEEAIESASKGCWANFEGRLLNPDPQTKAFLAENQRMASVAQEIAKELAETFAHADLRVRVTTDPDTGAERLRFEIITQDRSPEIRDTLRQFAANRLPVIAPACDHQVVCMIARA